MTKMHDEKTVLLHPVSDGFLKGYAVFIKCKHRIIAVLPSGVSAR